jgi:hypothetical protein
MTSNPVHNPYEVKYKYIQAARATGFPLHVRLMNIVQGVKNMNTYKQLGLRISLCTFLS